MIYTESDMLKVIIRRTFFADPLINIKKAFSACDMGNYWISACDRIAEAGLIDMEHVFIDIDTPGNLMVDCEGLLICRNVIEGCLGERHFKPLESDIRDLHGYIETCNEKLKLWRKIETLELITFIAKGAKTNNVPRLRREAAAELIGRTWINKARIKVCELLSDVYLRVRYWHIIKAAKMATAKHYQ